MRIQTRLAKMARSLSRTLTLTRLTHLEPSGGRLLLMNSRLRSSLPEPLLDDSDKERIAIKKLEDAIHRIIVKRSQPDWLPFLPGSSYWVPPKSKARGVAQVIGKLLNASSSPSISNRQPFTLTYNRGWPSSTYFLQGAFHSPLEGETPTKHTSQFEDEEG